MHLVQHAAFQQSITLDYPAYLLTFPTHLQRAYIISKRWNGCIQAALLSDAMFMKQAQNEA